MTDKMQEPSEAEVFDYLDDLRESGITNMFGAAPFVMREFNTTPTTARRLLSDWMSSYGSRKEARDV